MDTNQTPTPSLPATLFTPANLDKAIDDLTNPNLTFKDIAHAHGTTVEALAIWSGSPDIRRRLRKVCRVVAQRTAYMATCYMPRALEALRQSITAYIHEEANHPIDRSNPAAVEQRRRARETMIRAAKIIHTAAHPRRKPKPRHLTTTPATSTQPTLTAANPSAPSTFTPTNTPYPPPILNTKPKRAASLASTAGAAP